MTRRANSGPAVPLTDSNRKTLREARTITQRELAARLGVGSQYISNVEWGLRNPSLSLLNRWCEEIGLTCEVNTTVVIKRGGK